MTSDISRSFKSFEGASWKLSTLEYSENFSIPSENTLGARLNAFLSYLVLRMFTGAWTDLQILYLVL